MCRCRRTAAHRNRPPTPTRHGGPRRISTSCTSCPCVPGLRPRLLPGGGLPPSGDVSVHGLFYSSNPGFQPDCIIAQKVMDLGSLYLPRPTPGFPMSVPVCVPAPDLARGDHPARSLHVPDAQPGRSHRTGGPAETPLGHQARRGKHRPDRRLRGSSIPTLTGGDFFDVGVNFCPTVAGVFSTRRPRPLHACRGFRGRGRSSGRSTP